MQYKAGLASATESSLSRSMMPPDSACSADLAIRLLQGLPG